MIGVFDSGVGGLCSFERLSELIRDEELVYLADRKHAPYGTKCEHEIIELAKRNISLLRGMGAEKILIACCTASGIYERLETEERAVAIPIIRPAAEEAVRLVGDGGRVATISTDFTASHHIFKNEINSISSGVCVSEISAQILVELVELGARDGRLLPRECDLLDEICQKIKQTNPSALILGCTHFSHLKEELAERLSGISVIDTAALGAEHLAAVARSAKSTLQAKQTKAARGIRAQKAPTEQIL